MAKSIILLQHNNLRVHSSTAFQFPLLYSVCAITPAAAIPMPSPNSVRRGVRAVGFACEVDTDAAMRLADGERVVVAEVIVVLSDDVEFVTDVAYQITMNW